MHRVWRLADALLLLLMFLLPLMVLLGRAEGSGQRPTVLFWILLVLPWLILPWLWRHAEPEECGRAHMAAARRVEHAPAAGDELAALVTPVVDVQRAYALVLTIMLLPN